jgi:hypothetical protein
MDDHGGDWKRTECQSQDSDEGLKGDENEGAEEGKVLDTAHW